MKLTINAKDLTGALTDTKRYIAKRSTIPVLTCIQLVADGESVQVTATDLENGLVLNLSAEVAESGTAVIPLATLAMAIKGSKGSITIETSGEPAPAAVQEDLIPETSVRPVSKAPVYWTGKVSVCGASIPTFDPDSFPVLPKPTGEPITIPVTAIQDLIAKTRDCISKEESRFTLNGARVEFSGAGIRMVATDGHRLALAEVAAGPYAPHNTLVRKFVLCELLKLRPAPYAVVNLYQDDNHQFFVTPGRAIVSRKLTGSFPDYARVMPKSPNVNVLDVSRAQLLNTCERLYNLQRDQRQPTMMFRLNGSAVVENGGEITFSETLAGATVYTQYQAGYRGRHGKEITCRLNPAYLVDWLKSSKQETVQVRILDRKSAVELVAEPGYQCIVMQLRD